jgi:ribonuclease VapC
VIVDSSAVVAILTSEPERDVFSRAVSEAPAGSCAISAANYLETAIVVDHNRHATMGRELDRLLTKLSIAIAPVTAEQAKIARAAYRDFGKGSGHPAGLNFGDCFAYALAIERDEPLLYKGNDFSHTDVASATHRPDVR